MTSLALMTATQHSRSAAAPALTRLRPAPGVDARSDTDQPLFGKRARPDVPAPSEIAFGSFRLLPAQFLLLEQEKPVRLGSRALEILIALLERPGELVSKQELMDRVWPNIFVEQANLTVHMSALRRTLRDGRDGNRFIINVPGRGYAFVAALSDREPRAEGRAGDRRPRPQHAAPASRSAGQSGPARARHDGLA